MFVNNIDFFRCVKRYKKIAFFKSGLKLLLGTIVWEYDLNDFRSFKNVKVLTNKL